MLPPPKTEYATWQSELRLYLNFFLWLARLITLVNICIFLWGIFLPIIGLMYPEALFGWALYSYVSIPASATVWAILHLIKLVFFEKPEWVFIIGFIASLLFVLGVFIFSEGFFGAMGVFIFVLAGLFYRQLSTTSKNQTPLQLSIEKANKLLFIRRLKRDVLIALVIALFILLLD